MEVKGLNVQEISQIQTLSSFPPLRHQGIVMSDLLSYHLELNPLLVDE